MQTIVIVIHLLVVVALVGVVLLQRSEGGGLGIGGGSGFMTARGAANALTRTTAILAAAFFATSLALSLLARYGERPIDILDRLPQTETQQQGSDGGAGILDEIGGRQGGGEAESGGEVPSGSEEQLPDEGTPAPESEAPVQDTQSAPPSPESQVPTGQ